MDKLIPPTTAPLVSVVLVNYNSAAFTLACVASIQATAGSLPVEIIVVDNGSAPADGYALKVLPAEVIQIRSRLNLGFSGGNMQGVLVAQGTYIFLLNNDTLLQPGCLQQLVHTLEAVPEAAICAPLILNEHHEPDRWEGHFPSPANALLGIKNRYPPMPAGVAVDYVSGSALFIRRSVLNALGGLDTGYFLYLEEEDICWRARQAGHQVLLVKEATYVHFGNGSGAIKEPMQREYYISLKRFLFKNLPFLQACLSYAFFTIKELMRTRRGWVHARLAGFLLRGAPQKHSLRHRQVMQDV